MRIKVLLIITPLLASLFCQGYTFRFSNVTERNIIISYKLEGLSQNYFDIIPADQSIARYFPNAHCFGQSILWTEYKTHDSLGRAIPYNGGLDLVDESSGLIPKGEKQELFETKVANKYAFINMQVKVLDNETYQMTVDAAKGLTEGIETLGCQVISTVLGGTNDTGKDEQDSSDKAPDILAVDDFEDLLDDEKPKTSPLGLPSTEQPLALPSIMHEETPLLALPTTHSAQAIYAELQQYLSDKNGSSALMVMKNHKDKLLTIMPEENFDYAYKTLLKGSLRDYEFELIEFIIKSKPSKNLIGDNSDLNKNIDTKTALSSLTSKNKCRLGLAKIAKKAGDLAGVSLCRDLHFAIVDTGEMGVPAKKGKTTTSIKKPVLIAEINQGG